MTRVKRACRLIAAAALALTCALACGRDEPRPREPQPLAPPPQHSAAPAESAEPTPAPAPVEEVRDPTPEELPLPDDFSAEANKQITRKNSKKELDAIEKELDAEK